MYSVLVYCQGGGGKGRQPDRKWPPEHSARGGEAIVRFYTSVICVVYFYTSVIGVVYFFT